MKNITTINHLLLKQFLSQDKISIDMTLGNGYDAQFLSIHSKHVYAYEIQKQGILNSIELFKENNIENVTIFHESHENIKNLDVDYNIVVFNLGYLPGSDKTITTTYSTTINAIDHVLKKDSLEVLSIAVYPGHQEGQIESLELDKYIKTIPNKFKITKIENLNTKNPSPYLLIIQRR